MLEKHWSNFAVPPPFASSSLICANNPLLVFSDRKKVTEEDSFRPISLHPFISSQEVHSTPTAFQTVQRGEAFAQRWLQRCTEASALHLHQTWRRIVPLETSWWIIDIYYLLQTFLAVKYFACFSICLFNAWCTCGLEVQQANSSVVFKWDLVTTFLQYEKFTLPLHETKRLH